MFRSPSGLNVRIYAIAATFLALTLAALPGEAQFHRTTRETNANRRARIAREIQDTYSHRWEVGGGGGYLRFRSGEFLQKNNEVNFWANTTYYLSPKLGITGEIRGNYGNAKIANNRANLSFNPQISEYPYMAGVTYRVRMQQKYSVAIFALGGAAIGKFDADTQGFPTTVLGLWPTTNVRPAFSLGSNIDVNLYPNFAFRVAPNYMPTTFGSSLQNNLGVNVGLVYRFGHQ